MRKEVNFYLASPLGFNEPGEWLLYDILIPKLEEIQTDKYKVKILEPFRESHEYAPKHLTKKDTLEKYIKTYHKFNKIIKKNNENLLADSKAFIAILDLAGVDIDSGVAAEIRDFRDKGPIFGYRSDFRPGENYASEGVNVEVWGDIEYAGKKFKSGGIFTKYRFLEKAIHSFLLDFDNYLSQNF